MIRCLCNHRTLRLAAKVLLMISTLVNVPNGKIVHRPRNGFRISRLPMVMSALSTRIPEPHVGPPFAR